MIAVCDKVFVDSNIWLYALLRDVNEPRYEQALMLLEDSDNLVMSTQVINEVFANLRRKVAITEANLKMLLADWTADYTLVPLMPEQISLACDLRNHYKLSYWDSLMIASALDAGCHKIYSEDMQHGLVLENRLTIINPFTLISQ